MERTALLALCVSAASSQAALIEVKYFLTGTPIATYGSIGRTRHGDLNLTPIRLQQGTQSPIGIDGTVQATTVLQSDGSISYSLSLLGTTLTSNSSPTTTTPIRVVVTEDFELESYLTESRSVSLFILGYANFTASLQSAGVSMTTAFGALVPPDLSVQASAPSTLLYGIKSSQSPLAAAPIVRVSSTYVISLTSRGSTFTVGSFQASATMTYVPAPGGVGVLAGAMIAVRRRRRV